MPGCVLGCPGAPYATAALASKGCRIAPTCVQTPPRAVRTLRSLSFAAIAFWLVAPARIEQSSGLEKTQLLERKPGSEAVLRVNPGAHHERDHVEDDDGHYVCGTARKRKADGTVGWDCAGVSSERYA